MPLTATLVAATLGAGCVTRTVYVVDDRDDPPVRGGNGPVAQAEPAPEDDAGINSVDQFYEPLSPYGQWVTYPGYGMVFVPSQGVVGAGYRPYTNGHWEYTEWGWTWVDHHPFGWATGHYGRWFYDNGYGWMWVPGTVWSPAWVTWRTGGAYVGWAAMPPGSYYGARYSVYETSWVYVHSHHIGSPYVSSVLIVGSGYAVCYRETYPVYTTTVVYGRTYYRGPDYDRVTRDGARVVHRPVRETERERAVTRPPSGTTVARGRERERSSDRDGTSGSRRTRDGRDDGSDGRGGGRDGGTDRGGGNDGDRGHGNDRDRNDGDNPSRNPRNGLDDGGNNQAGGRDDGRDDGRDNGRDDARDGDRGHGNDRDRIDGDNPARNPREDADSRGNNGRGSAKGDERANSVDFPSGRGRDDAGLTDDGPRSIAPESDGRGLDNTRGPRPIDPIDDGAGVNPGSGNGRPDVTPDRGRDLTDLDRERDPRVDAVRPDNREQPNPERLRPIREPFPRDRFDGRSPGRSPSYEGTPPSRSPSSGGYDRTPSRAPSQPRMDAPSRAPSRGPSVGTPSAPSDSNNSTPSKKATSKPSSKSKSDSKSSTKKR